MCGIAGVYSLSRQRPLPDLNIHGILATIAHRGPDDEGIYQDQGIFLGVRRLAIIDPAAGHQPVKDEQGRFHVAMNGEVFDYDILLKQLQDRGHRFKSRCDTEVVVHMVEERWTGLLDDIDGQYAIAAYDARTHGLFLARDRMGICPLFYARVGDLLVFASEMKAIFATGLIKPVIDRRALDAVLALGCVPAPGAVFEGIRQLQPGHVLEIRDGELSIRTYWDIPFNDAGQYPRRSDKAWADEFRQVLSDATERRLKADVPVGLYLSGGIDSSTVAALTSKIHRAGHQAFSISFPEPGFDETAKTRHVAEFLDIPTQFLMYHQADLCNDLPRLIYHGESPLISTESVPMLALSGLARQEVKVVLSGEGADEALGGYIYFRWEALKMQTGEGLLGKAFMRMARPIVTHFFGERNPFQPQPQDYQWACDVFGSYPAIMMKFLHLRMMRDMLYTPEMLDRQRRLNDADLVDLPKQQMSRWDQYNRTLYLASRIFMTTHLLGSRGDRALMANSVEGRYPFLDRRVQEFLAAVPPTLKTRWHQEKILLRRAMENLVPREVIRTIKKPFLAPFGTPFVGEDTTDFIRELLTPRSLARHGYFDPAKVQKIVTYLEQAKQLMSTEHRESMRPGRAAIERLVMGIALTFVVSTQVLAEFVSQGRFSPAGNPSRPSVVLR